MIVFTSVTLASETIKREKYGYKNRLLRIQLLIHLVQRQKEILTQKRDCGFQTFHLF